MRPRGSYGEIGRALLAAAAVGPATVSALAERAQVGSAAARVTASRLIERGDLVVIEVGRPAVVAIPPGGDTLAEKLDELHRSFWDF